MQNIQARTQWCTNTSDNAWYCGASVSEKLSVSYGLTTEMYAHSETIHEQIEFCIRISVLLNMHLLAQNAEVL